MSEQNNTIEVVDHDEVLAITFDDCVKYHGRFSIGGLALGFRLMQLAFADLTPDRVPDRTEIAFETTFAGLGLRDAVEMISRALTRGVYTVAKASEASSTAPKLAAGSLWFKVRIGEREAAYEVVEGTISPEFIRLGTMLWAGKLPAEDQPLMVIEKHKLAETLLAGEPGTYLRRL